MDSHSTGTWPSSAKTGPVFGLVVVFPAAVGACQYRTMKAPTSRDLAAVPA